MKRMFAKALNLFSVLLLLVAIGFSFFTVTQPNLVSAAWDGTVATSFASGSGTEASPYVISTEKQLGYFFKQIQSGVTYEGKYIRLSKSLNMTGSTWSTGATYFQGNFHGMGYTITADCPFMTVIGESGTVQGLNYVLAVDYDSDVFCSTNYGTLFGCIVMGNAESDTTQESWTHSIGLLCDTNYGTIRGCGGVGRIYARGDDSDAYAGLIAENHGSVDRCYSAVSAGASAPGKYNYDYEHPLVARNNPSGTSATVTNSIYDSSIYTASTTIGYGLSTAELQSSTALSYLGSALPTNCRWVIDGDMGGYPHLANASGHYSYVTGHLGESRILYHAKSTYVTLTRSGSVGTIYYTLDANETDPSKFMSYSSGSSIFISGDQVLSTAVYYNGSFGAVTRQEFFSLPGSGTASQPYQISTPKQLTALGMFPDAHFILTEDITFTDADYGLTGAAPGHWKPISTFSGTLDGKGHAISGLKSKLGGLIDSNDGTVTSLRMIDHRLHGPGATGAIANWNSGTVTRCYTKSAFTLTSLPSVQDPEIGQEVGGVVGFNNGGTVSYCRNDGIVPVTTTTREAHLWLGGIVGRGKAENCINTGLLVVSNTATINYPYIGGITGGGTVTNCLAKGNVYLDMQCNYEVFIAGLSGHHSSGFAYTSVASDYTVTDVNSSHGALRKTPFIGYYQGSASSCYKSGKIQLPEDCSQLDFETQWMVSRDGIVPQGVMDENGHAYRLSTTQIYPTCRANGDQWLVCDICGDTDVITVYAVGHRYTNYVSDGNATCLENGTETAKCDRCEYTKTQEDLSSALGHTYENHAADGNATCTEDGTKTGKCIRCDETETLPDAGSALGHSFTGYVSNGDAACTVNGTETAKCDRCDVTDTRTDEGTALGHSFTVYTSNGDAQCEVDGTKTAKCDRCDVTDTVTEEGTMLGHSFTVYVSDGNAGCYTDGTETAKCDRCETTDTRTEEGTAGHLFTNYVSNNNATCLYPGTMTAKCDRCTVKDTKVEMGSQKGHSFTNYVSNGDADCLNDGTKTAKCDRCTEKNTLADEGSALGHSFTDYVSDGNVTCTEDGTQTAQCDRCEVTDTVVLEALGHDMGQWFTVTEATCTASGLEQSDCARCGHSETRVLPILPHSFEAAVTDPTCTEQGYTTYTCHCGESYISDRMPNLGHSFTEYISDGNATCTADGTQTAKCDRCEETDTITMKALGHSYTNYTSIGNATCTADGLKIATCDRCPEMDFAVDEGSMLGHSFTEYVSNGDATCMDNGTETAKCDRCDVTDTRIDGDSALGHDMGERYTVTEATCVLTGTQQSDCSRCDHFETFLIPALGHAEGTAVRENEQAPTCTEEGRYDLAVYCPICGIETERNTYTVPANGHSHTSVVTEPTCLEQGYTTYTCHCGDSYVDSYTDALGHSFGIYVSDENATCTEDGTKTALCDRCGATDTVIDEGSVQGHYLADSWQVVIAPTCTTEGLETAVCSVCGVYQESHEIPFTGHSYEAVVTAPTCQAGGYTTHTCHCGDSYVDTYTDALGHSFGEWYLVEDATYTEPGREQRDCETCGCSEVNLIPVLQTQLPEVSGSVDKATGKPVITWTYVENATGYVLWRSVEPEGPYVNEAEFTDGNRYVDEFAQAGVTYFYSVTPVFDDFCVSEGNTVSILCRLANPELNVSSNADNGKPKLSWNAVEGAEKYRIYRSTTETGGFEYLKSTQTVTSYTDTAAEVGITYFYKVKAYHANTQANSEWSNTVRFSCGLESPVVSISGNAASGKPIVKWESVEGAAKYRVYRSLKKTSGFELVYTGITARSYTDKTAEAGTNYYYKVKAYLADGKTGSPWSETVNRVCDLAAPAVSITGNSATGKPTVKWETVDGAVKYRVYRSESKSSGYELVYTGITARSYTDKTAEAGINYYYKVKAIHEKSSADSAYSGIVNRVCDLPKPVVEVSLTAGGNPRLVWEAIEGAVKYRVYRCDTRDGEYELVKTTVTATSFTDKEAASGQVWFYKVIALHETSSANSAYSTIVSVTAE